MAALHLFVAPEQRFDALQAVLADWHAAGLLNDHVWSMHDDPDREVLQAAGRGVDGRTLEAIAADRAVDRVHLVHVTGLTAEQDAATRFAAAVAAAFPAARITRIRALSAGAAEVHRFERATVDGWHTVLLAPEDGAAPDVAGAEVRDVVAGAPAIAAAIAGITGLWRGHERSPLDDEQVSGDRSVRLVRTYYRRLDAADVEDAVRARTLKLDGPLPLPVHAGAPALRVEDVALASRTMSEQLWQRHEGLLRGPREQIRTAPPKPIGAAEALRLFFSFLGAAIRNAPRRWLNSTVAAVRSRAAAVVQDVVFGSGDSAYSVVVGGMTADGRPASWIEHRDASERLAKALEHRVSVQHHAPDDTGPLWQDYVGGALTLADAGDRVPSMPPVAIGTRRGVMPDVADIVPGPAARFGDVSPAVTASIGRASVEAYDLLGARVLRERLRKVASESSIGIPAADAAERLQQWGQRHGGSFAVHVGRRVAAGLVALQEEVQQILDRLRRAASSGDAAQALQQRQRRLSRLLQILAAVAAVLVVVVVVLAVTALLSPLAAVLTVLGVLVAWLAASLLAFLRGQRDLFALLNERQRLVSQQEVDERNLMLALRDVRRVSDLYEQFLVWSRIIGVFLDSPLGPAPLITGAAGSADIEGLPRSVVTARAVPGEDKLAGVANELRRELFGAGWLGEPWEAALAGASGLLGARGGELDGPQAMFQQHGDAEGLLLLWQRALEQEGTPRASGDAVWARALAALARPGRSTLRDDLVGTVMRPTGATTEPAAGFFGLTQPGAEQLGRFRDALLSATAVTAGRTAVRAATVDAVRDGLGADALLVQLSGPIPEYELAGFAEPAFVPWTDEPIAGRAAEHPSGAPFDGRSF